MLRIAPHLMLSLTLICLSVGCSSGPGYGEMAAKMPELPSNGGRIFFYRAASPLGAAVQPDIRVNEEIVGKSIPGGFFYIDRPAGNYVVACSTEAEHKLSIALSPGDTRYVRTTLTMGLFVGQAWPTLEDANTALPTLKSCKYSASK